METPAKTRGFPRRIPWHRSCCPAVLLFHLLKAPSTTHWLLFWVSLFEAWVGLASPQPRRAPETVPTPAGLAHRTRIVGRYSPQQRERDRGARLRTLGLQELKRFSRMTNLVVLDEESPVDPQLQTTPEQRRKHLLSRIQQLEESGLFDYVEPDYLHVADAVPNDSAFSTGTLWGLRNQGQSGGLSGADIDAVRAWDITTGSTDVVVAVIDTGIRYTHQDLSAQMWQNPGESGALASDGIDNDGNGYVDDVYGINAITGSGNPMDDNGHGTHCAGTIGAAANGSGPHVGVAWNVRLMGLKFMDAGGSGFTSDAIECINFAVAKGARVLSCSWGGGGYETALQDAITRARNQGVLFVAAAGNESANSDTIPHYPSGYDVDNVISVAALDRSDNLAGFSNYGSLNVDLGAPGVDIYSTYHSANDAYATSSGTSMATPHVAGVAALVIARFPGISVFDLRQRLLATTVPVASLNGRSTTGGRVNAYNALTASPDGTLELSVSSGGSLIAGQPVTLVVQVTDLTAIGNATVTGSATGLPSITFRNDGASPDTTANDHLYHASITVPSDRDQLVLTIQASAPSKTSQTLTRSLPIARLAANDNFSSATDLTGNVIQATGNNQIATKESGEPNHAANNVGGKSVWWKWTAPSSGTATINTRGSAFDTMLGVYTGSTVNNLTPIANNDDESYPAFITSRVQFTANGGTTYRIAVDGYNSGSGADSGAITLNISAPPSNDSFANRSTVTGNSWQQTGSNLYATKEAGEPNHANNAGGQSVWWTWTAPANGPVVLHTSGSAFDTLLAVYTGSAANSLTTVASNDDATSGTTSRLSFTAVAGTPYQIAVDGKNAGGSIASGSITLSLSQSSSPALAPVSNLTTDEGQSLDLTLTATDADTATQDLTFSLVSGPSGMSVTGSGRLTWLPSEAQGPGSYSITVAVSDGVSSGTGSFTVMVREVNASPTLTAINSQTIEEGSTLSLTLSASDVDLPTQTLSYSLTSGPDGMTVTSTGLLTWTPTEAQGPGSHAVTVAVSDGVTAASRSFSVTVSEVNAAPTFAIIPDQAVAEGQTLSLTLSASDADLPAQALTFSLTSDPTGMTVTPAGLLAWIPTEAQGPGTYIVEVTVSDGVTTASRSFSVTVSEVNAAPTFATIPDQAVAEGQTLSLTLSASDTDLPAQTFIFSLTSGPTGMAVTPGGLLTWTPSEAQGPSTNAVTVAVSDGVTSVSRSFTVTVREVNVAPTFAAISDQTLDEGQPLSLTLSASDTDLPAQTLSYSLTSGPEGMTVTSGGLLTWHPSEAQGPSTNPVTVAVSDGVTSVSRSFTVMVTRNTLPLAIVGTVIDGYIAGGFVWFDANLNGVFETAEPNTSTDRQGNFSLTVDLSVFDTNRNGQIDLQEGRIIVQGGMDLGTGVKLQGKLMAPPGSSVVTPLTTLVDSVARASGQDSIALAESIIQRSLGLPEVSLTQFDPISSALQGNRHGVTLQAAAARVADTVSQIATLLTGLDPSVSTRAASTIVADQIAKTILAGGSLELENIATIHAVLVATVSSVGTSVPEATASRIAEAISEQNILKIAAASDNNPMEALRQITQIQTVVQTDVTRAILDLATNPTSLDGFTIQFTGDTLLAAIDKAPVGDLTGTLSSAGSFSLLNEEAEIIESGDSPVPLTVVRRNGASGIVTVEVVLNPSEGLRTNRISLRFADGEIQKTISPSMLFDDNQLPGTTRIFKTTLLLQAGSAAGARVENPGTGTLRVVDNDAAGTLGFAQQRYELREQTPGQPSIVIRRQEGTAGSITAIVSIGSETGTAGRDYLGDPMTVTFAPGELIKILPPFVLDDSNSEANEILTLTLRIDPSSPLGARVRTEDSSTEIVIIDDDQEPRLAYQAAAGGIELLCFGPEGSSYDLQASSDLRNWITISGSPVTTTGFTKGVQITLQDTSTSARFYRIRSP